MLRMLRVTMLWVLLLPYVLYWTGAAFNGIAIISNGDCMPVHINKAKQHAWGQDLLPDGMLDIDMHCKMVPETHFKLFSDIIDFHTRIVSIGDLLIELSNWLMGFTPLVWGTLVAFKLY